jgi:phage-related protein
VFQKKSKSGIATPKSVIDRIKTRLRRAELEHQAWLDETKKDKTL